MIRVVAVISLVCLLVMVLYLPSAHPPERFLAQLRTEHEATAAYWGDAPALRILSRALSVQDSARQAAPIPSALRATSVTPWPRPASSRAIWAPMPEDAPVTTAVQPGAGEGRAMREP